MFPPVQLVHDQHHTEVLIDGGVLANTPVKIALQQSYEFFGDPSHFSLKMLAIGAPEHYQKPPPKASQFNKFGAGLWLGLGLFNILLGVNDTTDEDLVATLLGDSNFISVRSPVTSGTDDMSVEYMDALKKAAQVYWREHGDTLRAFVGCI